MQERMTASEAPQGSTHAPGHQQGFVHFLCLVGPELSMPLEQMPFTQYTRVILSTAMGTAAGAQQAAEAISAINATTTQHARTTITVIVSAGSKCTHPHPSTPGLPILPEVAHKTPRQPDRAKSDGSDEAGTSAAPASTVMPATGTALFPAWHATMQALRAALPMAFLILWHPLATEHARMRLDAFAAGASMVTYSQSDLQEALSRVASQQGTGAVQCAWCGLSHLTTNDYWVHQPLYHIYEPNKPGLTCPICMEEQIPNLAVHLHEMHGPHGAHPEIRTNAGSAVIMHRKSDNKFLMVQEFALQGMWVPGGGNDPGERLTVSAVRECWEEAGQEADLKGLLEVCYDLSHKPPWRLAVIYAEPHQGQARPEPKTLPDFESAGACWVGADELDHLPLRNDIHPKTWYPRITAGAYQLLPLEFPTATRAIFEGSAGGEKLVM